MNTNNKTSSRNSDHINESNKFENHLETLPSTNTTANNNLNGFQNSNANNETKSLVKSNDSLSMLSFKSAESASFNAFASSASSVDKLNNSISAHNQEDENVNGLLSENLMDPNLENIKVNY